MFKKLQLKTMALLALLLIGAGSAWADEESVDFTKQGYSNQQAIESYTGTNFSIAFDKGTNSNAPKYYTSGTAIRCYGGNTMTVSSSNTITNIVLTFGSSDGSNAITTDEETYSDGTWSGSANSVKFTIGGTSGNRRIAGLTVTYIAGADTRQETTVTIDASAIGNTDIYTTDGNNRLRATVKCGDNEIAGAEVTWESSDTDVATINNDGLVTLVAVGTTTITAIYAGDTDYKSSSAEYELTVTDTTPYVQPTEVEIVPNYTFWGQTAQFSGDTYSELSGSKDNVSLDWSRGSGSTYANQNAMRFYKDNTLTFTAPTGYEIKSIVLDATLKKDETFTPGDFDTESKTWTGAATTVTMSRPSSVSGYATINKFTITLGLPSSVATPTFSVAAGTYEEAQSVELSCATDGATVYYTLDGTTPTAESTEYTAAIEITETCTLKAIAIKDGESSAVASATYTIELPLTTIAEVKSKASGTAVHVRLTNAQVVFVNGNDIYVRDATGAMDFYKSGITTLETGDFFDANIEATYQPYNGMPELVSFTTKEITKKSNSPVVAKVVTTAEEAENSICDLVKFEAVELDEDNKIGETGLVLYDKFNAGYTSTPNTTADISGLVIPYNSTVQICPRYESDIVYLDNAVAVEIGAAGMATFSSTEALDFTGVDAIAAYIATVTTEGKITFTRIYEVPANTGLLLRNALGEDQGAVAAVNVPVIASAAAVSENALVAVDTEITQLATDGEGCVNYILNKVNGNLGFYKANNQKVAAGKAYLQVSAATARGSFAISFDNETTGIATVENASVLNENYYNLNGQRIVAPQKGLYIVNGKKVVLK